MQTDLIIKDNAFLRQFESNIQDELVKIEYSQQDRKIFLTKIVMSQKLQDEGYVDLFIEKVLEIIKDTNNRVMPTNPTIARFMRKNRRKYKELLPVGINI